jgi:splicing factor 3A subunit 3
MGLQGQALFTQFYDKLGEIKNYHRKYPDLLPERPEAESMLAEAMSEEPSMPVLFSGGEGFGRYLDLDPFFQRYNNLKGVTPLEYWQYVETAFYFISNAVRDENYLKYVQDIKEYLVSFIQRTQPLYMGLKELQQQTQTIFNEVWEKQTFVPLGRRHPERHITGTRYLLPWETSNYDSMSVEGTKYYCAACDKVFQKDTVFKAHMTSKKHEKTYEKYAPVCKEICHLELFVSRLWTEVLPQTVQLTKENIQKKLARQGDDESDGSDDELDIGDLDADEPEVRLTKRFYPVGWDGNPIPYWLYRLHGLGIEYICEICGNTSYWGRRVFEKHFSDWRHAHGMKCLGLENTKEFFEITKIQDALDLAKKLKTQKSHERTRADVIEEYEDPDGNVLDKKTYDLLAKQFGY